MDRLHEQSDLEAHHQVRKRVFLRHLILKMIILPTQARDRNRENSKRDAFSCSGVLDMMRNKDLTEPEYAEVRTIEKNAAATQPLIAKTGSGLCNRWHSTICTQLED